VLKTIVAVAALLLPTAAVAQTPPQPPCGPTDQMIAQLGQQFGELPFVHGTNAAGFDVVLLLSPGTRTWTLLLTRDGIACMIMSGTDMQPGARPPEPGSPS
jgi:hypothetical protein